MNVFCVTSQFSGGCTFLEWSIHWLAGHQYYYNVDKKKWIEIVNNPLVKTSVSNAHGHKKNHPSGLTATQKMIADLLGLPKSYTYSLYPVKLHVDGCCEQLGIDLQTLNQDSVWKEVSRYIDLDYKNMIANCIHQNIPVAYVFFDQQSLPYTWNRRDLDRFMTKNQKAEHLDDLFLEFDQVFCHDEVNQWKTNIEDNVWDLRERIALNIRPFHFMISEVDDQFCYRIRCRDLWFDTEKVTLDLLDSLGLCLNHQRFSAWLPIVDVWQNIHRENIWFPENLARIIDAVINGLDLPLPTLTLKQECIIQHCLIYRHNLNFKTWNLTNFPNNTLELHNLLEPNIHDVNDY